MVKGEVQTRGVGEAPLDGLETSTQSNGIVGFDARNDRMNWVCCSELPLLGRDTIRDRYPAIPNSLIPSFQPPTRMGWGLD